MVNMLRKQWWDPVNFKLCCLYFWYSGIHWKWPLQLGDAPKQIASDTLLLITYEYSIQSIPGVQLDLFGDFWGDGGPILVYQQSRTILKENSIHHIE